MLRDEAAIGGEEMHKNCVVAGYGRERLPDKAHGQRLPWRGGAVGGEVAAKQPQQRAKVGGRGEWDGGLRRLTDGQEGNGKGVALRAKCPMTRARTACFRTSAKFPA